MIGYFKAGVISAIALSFVFAGIASKFGNLKTIDIVFPCFFAGFGISLLFPATSIVLEEYVVMGSFSSDGIHIANHKKSFHAATCKRGGNRSYITGERGGKFYVEIKNQKCRLEEGEAVNPKLIITASRKDWIAIAEGRLEGQRAFMEGGIKVEGDMNQLFRMQEVFQTR